MEKFKLQSLQRFITSTRLTSVDYKFCVAGGISRVSALFQLDATASLTKVARRIGEAKRTIHH